jgi:hypothetical protein
MKIVLQWDTSVSTMPVSQQSAFQAAVTYAASYFDRLLTDPLTITINVGWREITQNGKSTSIPAGTSEGGPDDGQIYRYAQLLSALRAHASTPVTASAYADLPAQDPSGGAGVYLSNLQAEALGLATSGFGPAATGSVGFGGPAFGDNFEFSPTDRAVPGEEDLIGIAEHEIAHALGRVSDIGFNNQPTLMDLFRFTGPGVLSTSPQATPYFSIDGGMTRLDTFATSASDASDWSSAMTSGPGGDAFDAFSDTGVANYVTSTDLALMQTLGFSMTPDLPVDDFNGAQVSDILMENTAGGVVVGQTASGGQLAYVRVGGLGPEWSFGGAGDFFGDLRTEYVIRNTAGAVVLAQVTSDQATYRQIATLDLDWSFEGVGDLLGDGKSDLLVENTAGIVDIGEVGANGAASFSRVAGLGPEWSFVGTADYLGDGRAQFLIENTAGAVVVGEVGTGGQADYTRVAGLGPEWTFVGAGDFLGDGRSDFLIENAAGAVVVGEVAGGQAHYTQVGGLGPEWHFVAAGDYHGTGVDSFVIHNTSGALVTGTVAGGQAQYASIGAVGPEWSFHG